VARRKPHPEPILRAAAKLNLHPSKCIHIGDQIADTEAAIRAGAIAVAVSWDHVSGDDPFQDGSVVTCSNWSELYNLVIKTISG